MSWNSALYHHLQYNHFPPISFDVFGPVAEEAIERANDGEWEHEITMPNDVTLTVRDIVEQLHLEFFLEMEEA